MAGLTITPAQARAAEACAVGYRDGLTAYERATGKAAEDDTPIPLTLLLDEMGVEDALWCLDATGEDRVLRLFAADCAERVVGLTGPDPRFLEAIRVSRLYARGLASIGELVAAWAAAVAAAWAAAVAAAWAAAGAAAVAAAEVDAGHAARDAARSAARAAARGDAEREWQAHRLREYLTGDAR